MLIVGYGVQVVYSREIHFNGGHALFVNVLGVRQGKKGYQIPKGRTGELE
jgi:hypothetical protein